MHPNEELLHRFYTAFQNRDYATMQGCYGENAVFNDPVFVNLDADHTIHMWKMLCVKGKDLQIHFSNIKCDEAHGNATWNATYIFSLTGNKVENRIKSVFTF